MRWKGYVRPPDALGARRYGAIRNIWRIRRTTSDVAAAAKAVGEVEGLRPPARRAHARRYGAIRNIWRIRRTTSDVAAAAKAVGEAEGRVRPTDALTRAATG